MKKSLVAYFSATGQTGKVAEKIAKVIKADLYEIKAVVPYTAADLIWTDENARSTIEMHDKSFRPAICDRNANIKEYDTIFLGFPIWWFVAPTIINTFLESYDFSGKTLVLFATSLGSNLTDASNELKNSLTPSTTIITGKVLSPKVTNKDLSAWLVSLNL